MTKVAFLSGLVIVAACGGSSTTTTGGAGGAGQGAGGHASHTGGPTSSGHTSSGAGASSSSAPSSSSSTGGGGSSSSAGGGGSSSSSTGGGTPTSESLFVAGGSVSVWRDAQSLTTDAAATFKLTDASVATLATALAFDAKRLFVGTLNASGLLVAFDAADSFTAGAAPAATLPASSFVSIPGGSPAIDHIAIDTFNDVLVTESFNTGSQFIIDPAGLTSASTAHARFTHAAFGQTPTAVHQFANLVFVGQISGAGILAWEDVNNKTGTPAPDFTLDSTFAAWSLAVDNTRLYAAGAVAGVEGIAIWDTVGADTAPTAPTFTMAAGAGIASNDFIPYITVTNNMLIACVQSGKVLVWNNTAGLTINATPSFTLTGLNAPSKAVLGSSGRLYVLESDGVSIFDDAATAPTLATKLTTLGTTGAAKDIAVLD